MKLIRNLILDVRIRWLESDAIWYELHNCKYDANICWLKIRELKARRV